MHLTPADRALLEPLLKRPLSFGPEDEERLRPYRELKLYGLVRIQEHRGAGKQTTVELTPQGRAALRRPTEGTR